jgi:aldehyde:ferredoxin oxidoreductase
MGLIAVSLDGRPVPAVPDAAGDFDGPVAALRHLLEAVTGPTDPVDAPVAVVASTVAGTGAPGTARCAAVGLSPLSGRVAETRAEGPYAAGLRAAGVTGIVLYGRASQPVTVVVSAGEVTLTPATALWGLETGPATDRLLDLHGPATAVAVIGPAGERQVPYASIVTCRHHPLPRLGLGAVLGGKRVKAIVCVGDEQPPVADPSGVRRIAADYAAAAQTSKLTGWQQGWPGFGVWAGEPGYAPVANFTDTAHPGGVAVVPAELARTAQLAPCPGCPTNCIKVYAGAGLHQEALAMLGPNLGVADPWPLLARCEQLGIDPVSLGGALAAAGLSPASVPAAVERIGAGHDSPVRAAIERVGGHDSAVPAAPVAVNDVAVPPFDPRVQPNLGLAYAVSPIGPRYDLVEHDLDFDPVDGLPESFGELDRLGVRVPRPRGELDVWRTAQLMRLWSGLDALGICLFAATPTRPLRLAQIEDLVEAITGDRPEVLALGARRLHLQHEVNRRLGRDAGHLPDLFFTEPVRAGRYAGAVLDRAGFTAALAELRTELGLEEQT